MEDFSSTSSYKVRIIIGEGDDSIPDNSERYGY
jgi:hypothetical protein